MNAVVSHSKNINARTHTHRYKAYTKSRPPASRISFLRAKELDTMSIHPLFCVTETTKGEAMTKLSSYRPKSTIIEIASMKSGHGPSQVMREKRKFHRVREEEQKEKKKIKKQEVDVETKEKEQKRTSIITLDTSTKKRRLSKAERRKLRKGNSISKTATTSKKKTTTFRDEEFYISTGPSSREDEIGESAMSVRREIDQVTFDIMGDETDRMKRDKQRGMLWDSKRGRYIKTSAKELRESRALSKQHKKDRAMGRVTEKKEFGKFYEKWSRRSKRRVGAIGFNETGVGEQDLEAMKELVLPHTKRNTTAAIANAQAQSELKSERMLRKQREEKERKKKKTKQGRGGKQRKNMFSSGGMFGGKSGKNNSSSKGGKKRRRR